jgi:dihydrolipoamide dehydrogenase
MDDVTCGLLIIGAGPGGYVCAIRAGQLGIDTIVVDGQPPGGTCLNVGCIPSKALIHAADTFHEMTTLAADNSLGLSLANPAIDLAQTMAWKDGIVGRLNGGVTALLKKAGVRLLGGRAEVLDGKTVALDTPEGRRLLRAEHLVLATGSEPVALPTLPFGGTVLSSTGALALTAVPASLAVVGGGYIGLELGTAFAKLGARVTVVEAGPRILPQSDAELTAPVLARLKALGVRVLVGAKARGLDGEGVLLVETADGEEERVEAAKVLVTVGRRPRVAPGMERLGLGMAGPFVAIDGKCRTSMRGVFAIGDLTGDPMLAHRAMAQGEMVAEIVAGLPRAWDKRQIPAVCFTDPEVVSVGLSPEEAKAEAGEVVTAQFPFMANGRAMTMEREDGFIRVVARKDTHVILGIQAVGAGVSELSASFSLAIEAALRLEDVTGTIHAHPTRAEGFHEACLRALGHALHI